MTSEISTLERYQLFIDGHAVDSVSGATFDSLNPYTGMPWARVSDGTPDDIDLAVAAARRAFDGGWRQMPGWRRAAVLRAVGDGIAKNSERLARLEVNDNGKLLREMRAQLEALPEYYYYFAGLADKIEGRTVPQINPSRYFGFTVREPVGVVGAITPWNSPLLLLTFKLAPLLAAGNTCVVKPSEHSPASTLAFAQVLSEAGLPDGVFNAVSGWNRATGEALASHPGIDKIAFTGSTATGIKVAQAAMNNVNKATLELGGKSAQVVFEDADIDAAVNGIMSGVFAATGQTCMAGSRLIVQDAVHDTVIERLARRAADIRLGDPNDPETEMGPLANPPQFEKVTGYFSIAEEEGASFACGGAPAEDLGSYFVKPTVITNLKRDSRLIREEVFGPVLSVLSFSTEEEAVELANDTRYGLAGAVWTENVHRAHRVAGQIRAGSVWINDYRVVGPGMPFGGFKDSGVGRENGVDAIDEYLETKSIYVELTGQTRDPFQMG
ncbi:Betaine aldehyde dehydrogenase [Frondihabitans sp. 762G35]|uniref:aldehyde dehydrogenase n=1 Tax=Frondihabitans sp. 762G35 TaxID=1446794 RepID=UPI000D202DA3|nr:aldehyde dehydrogenase [Frondihabitans sp. 762G35]ARC58628.1 Betaine aldehyde dehydrogenase [Frondihabitans sp. 762G35]